MRKVFGSTELVQIGNFGTSITIKFQFNTFVTVLRDSNRGRLTQNTLGTMGRGMAVITDLCKDIEVGMGITKNTATITVGTDLAKVFTGKVTAHEEIWVVASHG